MAKAKLDDYDNPIERGEDEKGYSAAAMLPRTVLSGKRPKVGERLVLRVDKILEDEVAVTVVKRGGGEDEDEKGSGKDEKMEENGSKGEGMEESVESETVTEDVDFGYE